MVSYMLHLASRNRWMNQKTVVKSLRKNIPEPVLKRIKKLKKQIKKEYQKDELYPELRYILNYLVKWFRHNYKIVSTGIRVLGYLPDDCPSDQLLDYYSSRTPALSASKFSKVCKTFEHNRDTGAQIFTALLRAVGFESRLVFSLPLLAVSRSTNKAPKLDYTKLERVKDGDLLYPYFWTELVDPLDPTKMFVIETMAFHDADKRLVHLDRTSASITNAFCGHFYPEPSEFNAMQMSHVVSIAKNGLMMDVSARYMQNISYRWFNRLDLRTILGRSELLFQSLVRFFNRRTSHSTSDNEELTMLRQLALRNYLLPASNAAMKRSPNFVTRETLRFNEEISQSAKAVGTISTKTEKAKVYSRAAVLVGRSEQHWKQLGRSVKSECLSRPVKTTTALSRRTKRHARGEGIPTSLYTLAQTTLYDPPKLERANGRWVLPRNQYGNIEIYRPWMIPTHTSWLKMKDIEGILSRYSKSLFACPLTETIEYVPVVVGFEYVSRSGHAVPAKQGVIVHESQEVVAKKVWMYGMIERQTALQRAAEARALHGWRGMLGRLRVRARMQRYENGK